MGAFNIDHGNSESSSYCNFLYENNPLHGGEVQMVFGVLTTKYLLLIYTDLTASCFLVV